MYVRCDNSEEQTEFVHDTEVEIDTQVEEGMLQMLTNLSF